MDVMLHSLQKHLAVEPRRVAQLSSCLSDGDMNRIFKRQTYCGMLFDTVHNSISKFQISHEYFLKAFLKKTEYDVGFSLNMKIQELERWVSR